jgi:hypothetical protein
LSAIQDAIAKGLVVELRFEVEPVGDGVGLAVIDDEIGTRVAVLSAAEKEALARKLAPPRRSGLSTISTTRGDW